MALRDLYLILSWFLLGVISVSINFTSKTFESISLAILFLIILLAEIYINRNYRLMEKR